VSLCLFHSSHFGFHVQEAPKGSVRSFFQPRKKSVLWKSFIDAWMQYLVSSFAVCLCFVHSTSEPYNLLLQVYASIVPALAAVTETSKAVHPVWGLCVAAWQVLSKIDFSKQNRFL
jgi:hypothetical protein